jgi:hypothetical protein
MSGAWETEAVVCDIVSFFLVTTDLYGKDRLQRMNDGIVYCIEYAKKSIGFKKPFLAICTASLVMLLLITAAVVLNHNGNLEEFWYTLLGLVIIGVLWPFPSVFGPSSENIMGITHDYVGIIVISAIFILIYLPILRLWFWLALQLMRGHRNGVFLGVGTIVFLIGKWFALRP